VQVALPVAGEGASPEYSEYFDPKVDISLRRAALKQMFSDPHFNVMDGLDTYVDDYSKPDPIPEAMLRQLNQAKDLFLFDDEKRSGATAADTMPEVTGEAESAGSATVADALTPPIDGCDAAAGNATGAGVAPSHAVRGNR
jgi:hypothetical protein